MASDRGTARLSHIYSGAKHMKPFNLGTLARTKMCIFQELYPTPPKEKLINIFYFLFYIDNTFINTNYSNSRQFTLLYFSCKLFSYLNTMFPREKLLSRNGFMSVSVQFILLTPCIVTVIQRQTL